MKLTRRFLTLAAAAAVLAGGLAMVVPSAPSASAAPLFRLVETNGNYAVGWGSSGEGDAVKEIFGGYRLNFSTTGTYNGLTDGTLNFTNGLYLATTADCEGVIQKGSSTATGTAWAEQFDHSGNLRMINRYCDNNLGGAGETTVALSGFNNGTQMSVCGLPFRCDGYFSLMHLG